MTFVAGAIIWSGYTLAWWGWQALTDHVPPGDPNRIHWPSIRDLISPGRAAVANRPRATSTGVTIRNDITVTTPSGTTTIPSYPVVGGVTSSTQPGIPGKPGGPPLLTQGQPGSADNS
ncbi:MAG TPA: hypothetical protein VGP90_05960 [Acidimicrobiia bacterium]|jgi:hypothetical protein|nr:hypothetical protein [Acidimicrobiia bacterium]